MDYKKKGRGTGPKELQGQAQLTRAIGTGGGKCMEEMAENGAARQAEADEGAYNLQELKKCAKTRSSASERASDLLGEY